MVFVLFGEGTQLLLEKKAGGRAVRGESVQVRRPSSLTGQCTSLEVKAMVIPIRLL